MEALCGPSTPSILAKVAPGEVARFIPGEVARFMGLAVRPWEAGVLRATEEKHTHTHTHLSLIHI